MALPSIRTGSKAWIPKTVKGRSAVQQNRVFFHHFFENIPNFLTLLLDHLLGGLDGRDVAVLRELVVDERLEELERHDLRQDRTDAA